MAARQRASCLTWRSVLALLPAAGDTTLGSESARVALTSTTASDNDVTYVATFSAGTPSSAAAITEAAIFNASSGGTMLCRTSLPR